MRHINRGTICRREICHGEKQKVKQKEETIQYGRNTKVIMEEDLELLNTQI